MGAAESKNAAEAVTNVSNFVDNSTKASTTQVNQVSNDISINQCSLSIGGDFNVEASADVSVKSAQMVQAKSDTSLQNNIEQKMMQEATSTVGSMGVGYANASNSVSMMANSTNKVTNAMEVAANQYNTTSNTFTCNDSYIETQGDLNINFSSVADFFATQTLDNENVTDIINKVSQSSTQKASATVEGLFSGLIYIILLIGVVGFVLVKGLNSTAMKIFMIVLVILMTIATLSFMYINKTPPLFDDDIDCSLQSDMGGCDAECINSKEKTILISEPPLRYFYALKPSGSTSRGNLVQMSIAWASSMGGDNNGDNGGYRIDTMDSLEENLEYYDKFMDKAGVTEPIPNPLKNPKEDENTYYTIPDQFKVSAGGAGNSGLCTPAILEVDNSVADSTITNWNDPEDCQYKVNDKYLTTTETPSNGIAIFNKSGWDTYINAGGDEDQQEKRAMFARFVLLDMMAPRMDLSIYINPNEFVRVQSDAAIGEILLASEAGDKAYKYNPKGTMKNYVEGISSGSGELTGLFGVCNNNSYKYRQFSRSIGIWIVVGLLVLGIIAILLSKTKQKKTAGKTMVSPQ